MVRLRREVAFGPPTAFWGMHNSALELEDLQVRLTRLEQIEKERNKENE
jgi:hypothetical protein